MPKQSMHRTSHQEDAGVTVGELIRPARPAMIATGLLTTLGALLSIAPFEVVVCPMGLERSEAVREAVDRLAADLQAAGIRYVVDDRNERPGVMFADWELIGVPLRITVGDRGLKEGLLELTVRRGMVTHKVAPADVLAEVQKLLPTL